MNTDYILSEMGADEEDEFVFIRVILNQDFARSNNWKSPMAEFYRAKFEIIGPEDGQSSTLVIHQYDMGQHGPYLKETRGYNLADVRHFLIREHEDQELVSL